MIAAGTLLQNRYLVERQIGQGGMGAVYVATDQRFGSTVALKETFFDDPGLRRAFEREARLLNRLRHAALPRVSDHFNEGDGQFLVMEYIPGEDLADMLKRRAAPFPARDGAARGRVGRDALEVVAGGRVRGRGFAARARRRGRRRRASTRRRLLLRLPRLERVARVRDARSAAGRRHARV